MSPPTIPPEAAAHTVPVLWWILFTSASVLAILGVAWRGFVWLRSQIREEFRGLTASEQFKALIQSVVTEAAAGWKDLDNRLHEEHRGAIKELRKRDEERAEAIKRLHGRVDRLWERHGGPPEVER